MALTTVPLGELAEFVRGVTFKPNDVTSTGVSVLRTKNVQSTLDLSDVMRIPPSLVRRADQYLRAGDTLISSANSWNLVGKCCWIPQLDEPAAVGGFVTALRPGPDVHPRYLYYWFSSPRVQAMARSFGNQTTNISNLSLSRCLDMAVPLPSMDAQWRIVDILDRADALCVKRREAIAHLDELTQSIFLDMFSAEEFETNSAGALMPDMRNGLSPATAGSHLAQVLTLSAVTQGTFNASAVKTGAFAIKPPADKRVNAGDFLICRGNGNKSLVGVGVYSTMDRADLVFPDTVIAGRVDSSLITLPFLEAAWRQPGVRRQIEAVARTTNGTYKVNQQTLSRVTVAVPPIERQGEYTRRAARINRHRECLQRAVDGMNTLFASLQQRAFAGRL